MIAVTDIHKTYHLGGADVHALRGVSLEIQAGEFIAIIGPSGSGKSTLMHILGLLDTPDQGTYSLNGRDVAGLSEDELATFRARSIGFVFQQFNLLPRVSARENVALPLIYSDHPSPASPTDLLDKVGLGDRQNHAPNELSGGQQQRVAIARALANQPPIIMADEPTGNLDTASSEELMGVLRELSESGLTVIVVTHDPEVANQAGRVITIRDGRIVTDKTNKNGFRPTANPKQLSSLSSPPSPSREPIRHAIREGMAMLRQALRALGANKTRTFLSMLGVMIGVAAVISVMALGTGARVAVEERIAAMGANLLVLRPGRSQRGGVSLGAGSSSRLTLADAEALQTELPGVSMTAPTVSGSAQVTYSGRNWLSQAVGTTPSYADMHEQPPEFGRFFDDQDIRSRARVAVVGTTVARELFQGENPVGKTIRINKVGFDVIGVLPESGASLRSDPNDQILIPVTTAMRRLLGKDYVETIEMKISDPSQMEYTELASIDLMMKRHNIRTATPDAFNIINMADIQKAMSATSSTMTLLLTGIGVISLVVGGIGIMNIMLVSVTERTREIGIRKAIGARRSSILAQFLVESVVVSACGGIIGISAGWGVSCAMSRFAGWSASVTIESVLVAFVFSAVVGVVFGLWPAQKASRLNPIDALRYE
jgi:macrolide transport system ATP-binding/permease protein